MYFFTLFFGFIIGVLFKNSVDITVMKAKIREIQKRNEHVEHRTN